MYGLFKRDKIWHYDFWFQKTRHQGSTRIKNHEHAKQWVSAYRTNLAKEGVGLVQKAPAPKLSDFLNGPFLTHVEQNASAASTADHYKKKIKILAAFLGFQKPINRVTELEIQGFKELRLSQKQAISTINGDIRTLRKALKFADKCGLARYGGVSELPGAQGRIFVVSAELEKQYLDAADYPLKQIAILMLDLGLRPEECVALRKTDVRDDAVTVKEGKTVNARRSLPQTTRTREIFELLTALHPDSEWIFKGHEGKHMVSRSVSNMHTPFRDKHEWPEEFVLYSFRHTFATRLAEACNGDTFILMKALGHGDTKQCGKYVHPSSDYLTLALKRKESLDRLIRGESEEVPTIPTTARDWTR